MPKEEVNLLPAVSTENNGGSMSGSDKEMLIKAILDLKRDVEALKAKVNDLTVLPPHTEEPDDQDPNGPNLGNEIRKVVDIKPEVPDEPEEDQKDLSIQDFKKNSIIKALKKHDGNRTKAAKEVGIAERTLYRYLKKYNLD